MKSPIRRIAAVSNAFVTFQGNVTPKTAPDRSGGLLQPNDWALLTSDGAYALEDRFFPKAANLLVVE